MQTVVDVACSSPPVTMNATKPAVQTAQAADQDAFGLVLQKASERIESEKQSDNANKSSEFKSKENVRGSDSTASERITKSKSKSEVEKENISDKTETNTKADNKNTDSKLKNTTSSANTDKVVDPEKSESIDTAEEYEKVPESEETEDPSAMVFGYITPAISSVDNSVSGEQISSDVVTEESQSIGQVQTISATIVQNSTTAAVQLEDGTSNSAISEDNNVVAPSEEKLEADQVSTPEADLKLSFSEKLSKEMKVGEKSTTEQNPVNADPSGNEVEAGKVDANATANKIDEQVTGLERKSATTSPQAAISNDKVVKPTEVETNQQTSPPDTQNGTTVVTAGASVLPTTQISEPARLAEAPKSEVINQVANQIDQLVKTNRSSVRMQLYPEELGHIDLRIVTTKDGIGVTMVTDKASTQQVLKSEMDSLRQSIEQAGIQLSNLNINQGHNSSRQQSYEQRQEFINSSYSGSNSDNSSTTVDEPKLHLTASVVDYRV